jgi:hypothetical protein
VFPQSFLDLEDLIVIFVPESIDAEQPKLLHLAHLGVLDLLHHILEVVRTVLFSCDHVLLGGADIVEVTALHQLNYLLKNVEMLGSDPLALLEFWELV